jgi:hypothetical protein
VYPDEGGHQRSSEVIRGHQRECTLMREVIRGHQRSSEVIRGHQRECTLGLVASFASRVLSASSDRR